ncbi:ACP S-malonyltransferase [Virgibacillus pantothenticus]|uniref:ACP S-malonyltransferase n=1 Tax=Virgibacillus pantothenticus TaxID=1473 RepID=UPI0009853C0E|nr:ACP S-malonyltransferase [Virgibacillus pantothenticus]
MKSNLKTACLFGGHGSQYIGMGKEFYEQNGGCRQIFNIGTSVLGYDVAEYCFYGVTEDDFDESFYSLTSLLAVNLSAYTMAINKGYTFNAYAGFSLGEYAALAASGTISIHESFELLKELLIIAESLPQDASYSMSVVNLPPEICEHICLEVRSMDKKVTVSNYNTHNQVTIAGSIEGIEQFKILSSKFGAKMYPISIHRAFHTEYMSTVEDIIRKQIDNYNFAIPKTSLYMNATGKEITSLEEIKLNIVCHFSSPVLWSQTLMNMHNSKIQRYIECGSRGILSRMVRNNLGIKKEAAYHISPKLLKGEELQL